MKKLKEEDHASVILKELKSLTLQFRKLDLPKFEKTLIPIVKRPGWTTPAEFTFVLALLRSMNNSLTAIKEISDLVVKGSKQVAPKTTR